MDWRVKRKNFATYSLKSKPQRILEKTLICPLIAQALSEWNISPHLPLPFFLKVKCCTLLFFFPSLPFFLFPLFLFSIFPPLFFPHPPFPCSSSLSWVDRAGRPPQLRRESATVGQREGAKPEHLKGRQWSIRAQEEWGGCPSKGAVRASRKKTSTWGKGSWKRWRWAVFHRVDQMNKYNSRSQVSMEREKTRINSVMLDWN